MTLAPSEQHDASAAASNQPAGGVRENGRSSRPKRRRSTSHLKAVPETLALREQIKAAAERYTQPLDKSRPFTKDELEQHGRTLLGQLELPEKYLGFTMVMIGNFFWKRQLMAVPFERRLLLLPHCLKHAEGCPAEYDEFGLDCEKCGACSIADYKVRAEQLGYKVLVAEGSPIVLKIIISGYVDGILGVACLNVLEKAIDKILMAGIPAMAVPLLSSDCRNTSVDEDWVAELIDTPHVQPQVRTRSYVHLMRAASAMFEPDELDRLAMRQRPRVVLPQEQTPDTSSAVDPAQAARGSHARTTAIDAIAVTESLALDFLTKGGKYSRPFITLAAYDALSGGNATTSIGAQVVRDLPDSVRRTALAIETFHKASLVHDDIEDNDAYRYGDQTLHQRFGIPTAINVGDYLIGLGYRLVSREAAALGADVAGDILNRLAEAHMKLSEGQGAELHWRDAADKQLQPIDALKIYALKTAPAFEVALYAGLRLAGDAEPYRSGIAQFARHLGVAFQILNDLDDWHPSADNKRLAAGDVLGGRPTVLWAMALEGLDAADRQRLVELVDRPKLTHSEVAQVRSLYEKAGVFEKAHRLVDKYQQRAEAVADEIEPDELRRLLYYLVDTVLDRPAESPPTLVIPTLAPQSPASTAQP